jgi:cytoskeletal protein CcmA (bactofilin family)
MTTTAYIGKTIRIKGSVTADEPLTVAGTIEGTVSVKGHPLTITAEGRVQADVVADIILVEGTAKGSLTAESRMTLQATAHVTGEMHAPVLSVAEGATLEGKVNAGPRKKALAA